MEQAAQTLKGRLYQALQNCDTASFDLHAYELRKAERYNKTPGTLTDYDCPLCLNRGDFMRITDNNSEYVEPCKCMKIRLSIHRMRMSGLESIIKRYTFDSFTAETDWQKQIKDKALAYMETGINDKAWFYIGGQPGCGKTHICTAICRKALYDGYGVLYMPWMTDSVPLKAMVNDEEKYIPAIDKIKTADLLYIDDFMKPVRDLQPTTADVKLAYDIINYRYINALPTLISSEKSVIEMLDIDEATGSRIYERSKGYTLTIAKGNDKNWRLHD